MGGEVVNPVIIDVCISQFLMYIILKHNLILLNAGSILDHKGAKTYSLAIAFVFCFSSHL